MGPHTRRVFFAVLVVLITTICWSQQPVTAAQRDAITQQYLNLPLNFEVNRGQATDDAKFLARASGYGVMLERGSIAFVLPGEKQQETVRLDWIGAQTQNLDGEQPLQGRINYMHGSDPKAWVADVPTFARVRYRQIYPGVDLIYYGTNRQVEYDLVVAPGVDPVLSNWNPSTGYLNPLAFSQPADGTFGDLGRNSIFGPRYWNVDFSVSKSTPLFEGLNLQLRAEMFNILNHPNFALPNGSVTPGVGPIGTISQTPDVAQGNPGLGGGGPRVIQLAAKFVF